MSDSKTFSAVFFIVDEDNNVVGEKKQLPINLSEEDLKAADARDAEDLKRCIEIEIWGGKPVATAAYLAYGRGHLIRETLQTIGLQIGRVFENELALKYFGSDHLERLEAANVETFKKLKNKNKAVG